MKKIFLVIVPIFMIAGFFTSCSRDEPSPTGPPVEVVLPVKINELYTQGALSNPDWIEMYNPNNDSVNIGGYKVYNITGKNGTISKKIIPTSMYIRGKSHFVLVVNDTISTTGFNLSNSGETVWFENGSGTVIDSIAIPALGVDSSYARKPDGSSTWLIVTPPTKGQPNSILAIVMNEIFSRGIPGDADWIEMYNPNATSIDISAYKIYDAGGQVGSKPKKEIPAGTIIPGNGFYVITVDTVDASGFGLSSAGEAAWLENANGNIIDNVTFPAMPVATSSYGRVPNGASTWQIMNTITKGGSNCTVTEIRGAFTMIMNASFLFIGLNVIGCFKKNIVVFFCFGAAFIGCKREAPAQGTNIVPPGIVTLQPIAQYYIGTDVSEPSGIIYNGKNNSFFVISDSHKELYEIDFRGALLRSIPSTGTDLEGISLSRSGDTIFVVEERNRVVVSYLTNGTKLSSFSVDVATIPNNGLEGVAVDKNSHLFVLNEKLPGMLLEYLPNGTEIKRITLSFALDYSDIFFDDSTDCLWIVSDESKKVMKISRNGELLSQWLIPFSKGEGITIVRDTMYIVNDEDAKLYIFNKPK